MAAASEQQLAARQPSTTTKQHVKPVKLADHQPVKQKPSAAEPLVEQVAPIEQTGTPMAEMYY